MNAKATEYGQRVARTLLHARKGHGGGPCTYRVMYAADLAALASIAWEAGFAACAADVYAGDPKRVPA